MAGKRGRKEGRTRGQGRANWNHPEQHSEYSGIRMTNNPPPHPDEGSGSNYSPGYEDYLLNRSHGPGQGYRTPPAYGAPAPGSNAVGPQSRDGYRTPPAYRVPATGSNSVGPQSRHGYKTPPDYGVPAPGSNAISPQHSNNRNAYGSGRLTTFDRVGFGQEPQRTEYVDHDDQVQSHHPIVHRHAPLGMPRRLGSGPEEFQRSSWDHTHRRSPVQQNPNPRGSSPPSSVTGSSRYSPPNPGDGWSPHLAYSPTNPAWSPPQPPSEEYSPTSPKVWASPQAEPEVWSRPSRSRSRSPHCCSESPPSNQWSNYHNQSPQSSHQYTTMPSPESRGPPYS